MTSDTILLVALLVFSFFFARALQKARTQWLLYTGLLHVLLGLLLGPYVGLGVLNEQTLKALTPLALLLTGVVGFLLGLRVRDVLGKEEALAGSLCAVGVFALVGLGTLAATAAAYTFTGNSVGESFVILGRMFFRGQLYTFAVSDQLFWLCLTLAACAAVTSSSVIANARKLQGARGKLTNTMYIVAQSSEFLTVLAYGLLLSASRALESASVLGLSVTEWTVAATGSGVLCGLLFSLFIGREGEENRIYFASIGLIIFGSGIGSALGVSPLFVNLVTGATVAMSSNHVSRLRSVLENLQEPVFVLLFILAGAFWEPAVGWLWVVPIVYFGLRTLGWITLTPTLVRYSVDGSPDYPRVGQGLLGQDAVPLAVGVSFAARYPDQASLVLSAVITGYVVANLLGALTLRRLLVDNQELPAAGEAKP